MESVRDYFSGRFGVEATGFIVLAGSDYEALSRLYMDRVGDHASLLISNHSWTPAWAWIETSSTGAAVMTLAYGTFSDERLESLRHFIAHEYFHVLQGQLALGFTQLQDGEMAYTTPSLHSPNWLVEGTASYADYDYSPRRTRGRPFLNDRYTPYKDIASFQAGKPDSTVGDLATLDDYRYVDPNYFYAASFAASAFLLDQTEEDSYVRYWKLLGERLTWEQAFEDAFGIGFDDFNKSFVAWLPSKLPRYAHLDLQVRWPNMEKQPLPQFSLLSLRIKHDWAIFPSRTLGDYRNDDGLPRITFTYDEAAVGTGYLSLWWRGSDTDDRCKEYLVGWYKDGELTSRRGDATAVEFTGKSSIFDWSIPGHPDTLPRLEEDNKCD